MSLQPDLEAGLAYKGTPLGNEEEGAPFTILPVPTATRRPSWVSRLLFKHEHVIAEDNSIQPDGFRLGTMSDTDFCQWVPRSPKRVQNTAVCHVTWWRSKQAPLHHQFVILTLLCTPAGREEEGKGKEEGALYDICLERIGKGMGFKALAEHRVTITPSKPLTAYEEGNTLLFGIISDDATYLSQLSPPTSYTVPVPFTDELDIKWRGPPATLRHVAAYVHAIVHLSPRYSIASTNCYYFARFIVHLIGLRHFSFPYFASSFPDTLRVRSERLDPSSIGKLFKVIDDERNKNGSLLAYAPGVQFAPFVSSFAIIALTVGFVYGLVRMFKALPNRASKIAMETIGVFFMVALHIVLLYGVLRLLAQIMILPFWKSLVTHTAKVIAALDDDPELTNPLGKRGDYVRVRVWVLQRKDEEGPSGIETFEIPGPREAVVPWDRPEQVYIPPASPNDEH